MDKRIADILDLLNDAPLDDIQSVLDVGIGDGQLSFWFSEKGKQVTATGVAIDSYKLDRKKIQEKNIKLVESFVEKMPFLDESFDAVVLSHVLEHCMDISTVLREIRRVLTNKGFLFLFVPPFNNYVIAGHPTNGWNVGQLVYTLVLNGFNVKDGKFIQYGNNVAAFVQKSNVMLPSLRWDSGDVKILFEAGLLPQGLKFSDPTNDGFRADVASINWKKTKYNNKQRLIMFFFSLVPSFARRRIISATRRLVDFLSINFD